jgi:hypothetical protein
MKKLKLSALHNRGVEVLSREQMKNVLGKMVGGSGEPTVLYTGCNYNPETELPTCDYRVTFSDGTVRDICGASCIPGDGFDCLPD